MNQNLPVGARFAVISRAFRRELDHLLENEDLTGVQFGVLGHIKRLESNGVPEINQKMLEDAAHVTHPTMIEILKKLDRSGYIHCCPSETDRRQKKITSTDKAEELLRSLEKTDEHVFRNLCSGLSSEEITMLENLTDKILKNVCSRERRDASND